MNNILIAFDRNPDGSWTSNQEVTMSGPEGDIEIVRLMTFFPDETFHGLDVAAWLERRSLEDCRV
ncbi:MAG: hypothetical protein OEU09_19960 [Rhodospirillales bacterium]|nr:hypothetical protein [Rhodospirillales bacterium]MDH3913560.1 hypothetical protein [Rhodospirillales bacterium]MDH3920924.1 hypothetical protein [Rhodospirillales bacterium]MDH3967095.1 hypothetical protein [Rhodospirillales bacterium]